MRAFPIIHDLCVLKSIEENRIFKKPRKKGKPAPFMLAVAFAFAVSLCFSLRSWSYYGGAVLCLHHMASRRNKELD